MSAGGGGREERSDDGESKGLLQTRFARPITNKLSAPRLADGCPKIVNLGEAKKDNFYQEKKYGFKKR